MRELTEIDKSVLIEGIPESNLVLWCPGLQGKGTQILDRSANANHATITGATWVRLPSGLYVLEFNGTTDVVNFGSPSYYDSITGNCTFEAWVKPDTLGGSNQGKLFWLSSIYMRVQATAAALFRIIVGGVNKSATSASNSVPLGTWTHIAGVFNSVNVLIYTNLTLVTGDATGGPVDGHATASLMVGNRSDSLRGLDGKLGLPRVYDRALSLTELTRHYNRERSLFGV